MTIQCIPVVQVLWPEIIVLPFYFLLLQDIVTFPYWPREGTSSPLLGCLSTSCCWTPSRAGAMEPTARVCLILTQEPWTSQQESAWSLPRSHGPHSQSLPDPYQELWTTQSAWSLPGARDENGLTLNATPSHRHVLYNPVASFGYFLSFSYLLNWNCIILLSNSNNYEI